MTPLSYATEETTFDSALGEETRAILDAAHRLEEELETFIGMTPTTFQVLEAIVMEPGILPSQVSRALNLAHVTVSGVTRTLRGKGWVTFEPDANDKRLNHMMPTVGGLSRYQAACAELALRRAGLRARAEALRLRLL